jgi:hypothetical protein
VTAAALVAAVRLKAAVERVAAVAVAALEAAAAGLGPGAKACCRALGDQHAHVHTPALQRCTHWPVAGA